MKRNTSFKILYLTLPLILSPLTSGEESSNSLKVGFGSCVDEDKPQVIWKALEKENLNDFFFMGDNVYGDMDSGELTNMWSAYAKQEENFPAFFHAIENLEFSPPLVFAHFATRGGKTQGYGLIEYFYGPF